MPKKSHLVDYEELKGNQIREDASHASKTKRIKLKKTYERAKEKDSSFKVDL